jgi:hypothetical protein
MIRVETAAVNLPRANLFNRPRSGAIFGECQIQIFDPIPSRAAVVIRS